MHPPPPAPPVGHGDYALIQRATRYRSVMAESRYNWGLLHGMNHSAISIILNVDLPKHFPQLWNEDPGVALMAAFDLTRRKLERSAKEMEVRTEAPMIPPASPIVAIPETASTQEIVESFVRDCCMLSEGAASTTREFYDAYVMWHKGRYPSVAPLHINVFSPRFYEVALRYPRCKTTVRHGKKTLVGLRLGAR